MPNGLYALIWTNAEYDEINISKQRWAREKKDNILLQFIS